jgi:hypothetical protein
MCFDGPSAERQTEAHAGSIGSALLERAEQFVNIVARETATLVLHLGEHAFGAGADPQRDGRVRARKLEGILQHIRQHRGQDVSVGFDGYAILYWQHCQCDAAAAGV